LWMILNFEFVRVFSEGLPVFSVPCFVSWGLPVFSKY
jgi:hypothetical protein